MTGRMTWYTGPTCAVAGCATHGDPLVERGPGWWALYSSQSDEPALLEWCPEHGEEAQSYMARVRPVKDGPPA